MATSTCKSSSNKKKRDLPSFFSSNPSQGPPIKHQLQNIKDNSVEPSDEDPIVVDLRRKGDKAEQHNQTADEKKSKVNFTYNELSPKKFPWLIQNQDDHMQCRHCLLTQSNLSSPFGTTLGSSESEYFLS